MSLLEIKELTIHLHDQGIYPIIPKLSLSLEKGKCLGIVGESGCGKSILTKSILRILPEHVKVEEGSILFEKIDLLTLSNKALNQVLGKEIATIFQNQMTSLNPLHRIERQIMEMLNEHQSHLSKAQKNRLIDDVLKDVGLDPVIRRKYPHELSGGQRQRIVIAMAIINRPKLLIADEPTTALDVTVQAQILRLLKKIQQKYNMTIIFISHDLEVIQYMADSIAVMYAGTIVEQGLTAEILSHPKHPYTEALIQSLPEYAVKGQPLTVISGHVPSVKEKKEHCPFYPRCKKATPDCLSRPLQTLSVSPQHEVLCHHVKEGNDE